MFSQRQRRRLVVLLGVGMTIAAAAAVEASRQTESKRVRYRRGDELDEPFGAPPYPSRRPSGVASAVHTIVQRNGSSEAEPRLSHAPSRRPPSSIPAAAPFAEPTPAINETRTSATDAAEARWTIVTEETAEPAARRMTPSPEEGGLMATALSASVVSLPTALPGEWDVVSPELVLVSDPDAAQRARGQLPEPLSWRLTAAARLRAAAEAPTAPPPAVLPRRRRTLRYVVAAAVLGVLGYGVAAFTLDDSRPVVLQSTDAGMLTHLSVARAAPTNDATRPGAQAIAPTAAAEVTPTAVVHPRTAASTSTRAAATVPRPPAATRPSRSQTGFIPSRTWSWASVPGETTYVVTFFRDGRLVIQRRVQGSTLEMPSGFRFLPGRYRWTVRAEGSTRSIVESSFVLGAAQAAAANASTR